MGWLDSLDPTKEPQARTDLNSATTGASHLGGQGLSQAFGQDQLFDSRVSKNLQDQANGTQSLSAEQLRQGLQMQQAQQQAYAASASPQNAAMASRLAMMNQAKLGYGLSGAQATAGLQERQAANQTLAQLATQQRAQDIQAAQAGYGTAVQGYGQALQNQSNFWGQVGPAISGGLGVIAMSDRRAKHEIKDADGESKQLLERLKTYRYKYKDESNGKGSQLGIMAQEMERAGLGHAVIDTPRGKMIDGAKTATSTLALTAALARRVSKLESDRG